MSAHLEIPFAIGSSVWTPMSDGVQYEYVPCPECVGSGLCTVALDNGESYRVACGRCSTLIDQRGSGEVRNDRSHSSPYQMRLDGIDRIDDGVVVYISYTPIRGYDRHHIKSCDVFTDRDACQARCHDINVQRDAERRERETRHLMITRKNTAASVSWWSKRKKQLEGEVDFLNGKLLDAKNARKTSLCARPTEVKS